MNANEDSINVITEEGPLISKENTKAATYKIGNLFGSTLDKANNNNKKAMTYMPRGMSLATRPNLDPFALIERAKEKMIGKLPMKISWENLTF